jgi:hypothetical protein
MGPLSTLLFILAGAGMGAQILRWIGIRLESAVDRLCFGAALGLGIAAYAVLALGLAGRLTTPWLAGLVLAIAVIGAREAALLLRDASRDLVHWAAHERTAADWAALALVLYCVTLALITVIPALAPPTDLDWDGLSYHLAAPKIYLRHHRIHFIAYDSHTNFPFTVEMLYALGLWWGDAGAAKLFHWASGWLTALAVAAWVNRYLRRDGDLPAWAPPLAAALWMSIPLAAWEAGTAYVDLGTALFQFLALAALPRAVGGGETQANIRWALLAGILTGFALGTKATAMVQFGLLGLALACVGARSGERRAWAPVVVFAAAAVVVGSPWYIKSYLWTNNPVYPFFYNLFPRSVHWNPAFDEAYRHEQQSFGRPGHTLFAIFRAPWDLAFHARDFFITTQRTLKWDQWASLGPLAVGFGPMVLYTRRMDRRALALAGYALASGLVWWFLSQQSRYLMPVFAALAAAAVAAILALPGLALRRGAIGLAVVALAVGLYLAGQMAGVGWTVVSGSWSRAEFMNTYLPDLYSAAQFVNGLPADSRIALYQDTRGFYFDRDYFWANPGQNDLVPYDRLRTGDELADFFHAPGEAHATHVLINLTMTRPDIETQHWIRLLFDAVDRHRLVPVYDSRSGSAQGRGGIVVMEVR